ncbi:Hypothetical predicted protein [Paramuricea clavata]|uniref:Uncharacterized protein n=1 Tax=Paramuricea clavata TaxID=317549 RepID=A0A6S7HDL5_PARCT|nr:Hypothetical predicted protein [Paramuricea clavata]
MEDSVIREISVSDVIEDSTNCSRVDNPVVSDSHPITVEKNSETGNMAVCKTKLGKAVVFVLGQSTEVLQFDKARQQHKQSPSDKFFFAKFMNLVAVMEVRVVKQTKICQELGQWEKEFFLKHNSRVAIQKDIEACPQDKLLRDKLKYAKAILITNKE